jgi:uncharacterized protein (TIRG00374 family)
MTRTQGIALRWVLGLAIGLLFVWLSSRQWPMEKLLCEDLLASGASLSCMVEGEVSWRLEYLWLLPAFLVLAAVHFLRVLRWRPLLDSIAPHTFSELNRISAVSFMVLFILPLRLGELARPYMVASLGRVRKSEVLGTVVLERVLDGLLMAFLLFCVLALLPADHNPSAYYTLRVGSLVALAVFFAALGILWLALFNRDRAAALISCCTRPFSRRLSHRLSDMTARFIEGLRALPSPMVFARCVLWTALYWAVNGFYFWFIARAFGLQEWVTPIVAYAMMAAAAVGMMIPNSPANVGSFWYFLLLPMYVSGMPAGAAPIAFGISVWAMMLIQYCVFGLWFMAGSRQKNSPVIP